MDRHEGFCFLFGETFEGALESSILIPGIDGFLVCSRS
jgi:hypothetical protein